MMLVVAVPTQRVVDLGSIPSSTLRVFELTFCKTFNPPLDKKLELRCLFIF